MFALPNPLLRTLEQPYLPCLKMLPPMSLATEKLLLQLAQKHFWQVGLRTYPTQCIYSESQLPHRIVNLLFTITN
jgi:hypothetical protein